MAWIDGVELGMLWRCVRKARREGLERARAERIDYHRKHKPPELTIRTNHPAICVAE